MNGKPDWLLVLEKILVDKFSGSYKLWIENGKVTAYQQIPVAVSLKDADRIGWKEHFQNKSAT